MTTAAMQFLFYIFSAVVLAQYLLPLPSVARAAKQHAGRRRGMSAGSNSARRR